MQGYDGAIQAWIAKLDTQCHVRKAIFRSMHEAFITSSVFIYRTRIGHYRPYGYLYSKNWPDILR